MKAMSKRPRIAIVHYHFRWGGVTRVVQVTTSALRGRASVAWLAGERPVDRVDPSLVDARVVQGLNYAEPAEGLNAADLADRLEQAAVSIWGTFPDVWHFHNHALGKNAAFTQAVYLLASRGHRLLLHIHDFAEDGRPANYRRLMKGLTGEHREQRQSLLYPVGPNVHYAVLNARDRDFLLKAGVPPACLHLLPNPIRLSAEGKSGREPPARKNLLLYPTRAIRRKNVGEFLLWSALMPNKRFALTLAPQNPLERPFYRDWVNFTSEHKLPVDFEVGVRWKMPFTDLLASAEAVITTSVAEGFGLAYLEPALVGRPVAGRDLADITGGFRNDDIRLTGLYERLMVPLEWVGQVSLTDNLWEKMKLYLEAYDLPCEAAEVEAALAAMCDARNSQVDFGRLDEPRQRLVIERLLTDKTARENLLSSTRLLSSEVLNQPVEHNRSIITSAYSPGQYAERLLSIYENVGEGAAAEVASPVGERLLRTFTAPERFNLLRT